MLPTYFISHGGGPWPYIDDMRAMFHALEASLVAMPKQIKQTPKAILMISGHWERNTLGVMSNPHPSMEYDYYGFPDHTYQIQYPAPGSPQLAERVTSLIKEAGLVVELDPHKGFDHGAFAPMAVMYPDADMPLIQLSLQSNFDPAEHLALGRALAPLRAEGVLIIGSGLSYHNLSLMGAAAKVPSMAFDNWLHDTLASAPEQRSERLIHWTREPSARIAHPREDHLIPLMVALGAAEHGQATCVYHEDDVFGGMTASSFRFD